MYEEMGCRSQAQIQYRVKALTWDIQHRGHKFGLSIFSCKLLAAPESLLCRLHVSRVEGPGHGKSHHSCFVLFRYSLHRITPLNPTRNCIVAWAQVICNSDSILFSNFRSGLLADLLDLQVAQFAFLECWIAPMPRSAGFHVWRRVTSCSCQAKLELRPRSPMFCYNECDPS